MVAAGYELLALLLPLMPSSGPSVSEQRGLVVRALLAGLEWDVAESPVRELSVMRVCVAALSTVQLAQWPELALALPEAAAAVGGVARAMLRSPAQAAFVVAYWCFLVEECAAALSEALSLADVAAACRTLLLFVDRSKVPPVKVTQSYRALTQLFLLLPLRHRAALLDDLAPSIVPSPHSPPLSPLVACLTVASATARADLDQPVCGCGGGVGPADAVCVERCGG